VGLFTIELELGRETRAMIERVVGVACAALERTAANASMTVELGQHTRDTLTTVAPTGSEEPGKARGALGGLVDKTRDEAKRVTGT
jgi:hypothetical protein